MYRAGTTIVSSRSVTAIIDVLPAPPVGWRRISSSAGRAEVVLSGGMVGAVVDLGPEAEKILARGGHLAIIEIDADGPARGTPLDLMPNDGLEVAP